MSKQMMVVDFELTKKEATTNQPTQPREKRNGRSTPAYFRSIAQLGCRYFFFE